MNQYVSQSHSDASLTSDLDQLAHFEGSPEQFIAALLQTQCRIGPARFAAILSPMADGAAECMAVHPDPDRHEAVGVWLKDAEAHLPPADAVSPVIVAYREANAPYGSEASTHTIFIPLRRNGVSRGVAAFLVRPPVGEKLRTICQRLELSANLLSLYEMRLTARERGSEMRRLKQAQQLVAAVNQPQRWQATAMALCNQTASDWQAARVGLGLLQGRYIKLHALSHTEKFTRRMQLVQDLESAMEECLDQDVELLYPPPPDAGHVHRATSELSTRQGPHAVCLVPLRREGKPVGVLSIERDAQQPFTLEELETLRLAAELVTPRLLELRENDRWIGVKVAASLRRAAAFAVGPEHTWAKLLAIGVIGLILFLAFARGTYRVEAPFLFDTTEHQIVAAPFSGYIDQVEAMPGDVVHAGTSLLAVLDTSELQLELASERAELARFLKEADLARRRGETAEEEVAYAEADRIRARIALLEQRMGRAELRSPVDGVIARGDWRRHVGGHVETGQELFEVAQLDSVRAELAVSESRISDVHVGQRGRLATNAYPSDRIPFEVEWISPVAEVVDQNNVFIVHVRLLESRPWLRPGMEGSAKLDVEQRHLVWIWSRDLIDWLRMALWI